MRQALLLLFICLCVQLTLAAAPRQAPALPPPTPLPRPTPSPVTTKNYESLLARVKQGDHTVDFKELRLAYTETKDYNPYGGDLETRTAMATAFKDKQYDKALEQANKVLSKNYVDAVAHLIAFVSHRELQHTEQSAFHKYILDGLLKSISNSGDGKSEETAFVVISTDEEYMLFN